MSNVKPVDGLVYLLQCSNSEELDIWSEFHEIELPNENIEKKYAIEIKAFREQKSIKRKTYKKIEIDT